MNFLEKFDRISIEQISKRDLLLILKALEYTYENTKIEEFKGLQESLVEELCVLTEIKSPQEFLNILENV